MSMQKQRLEPTFNLKNEEDIIWIYKVYKNPKLPFLFYDITNKDLFHNLEKWHEDLKDNCNLNKMILILSINNVDLENDIVIYRC